MRASQTHHLHTAKFIDDMLVRYRVHPEIASHNFSLVIDF
ncbi:hypothetical protein Nizo1839_0228 [Lactiplantibacillus plantarum]|nr:hypothetical protein SF2A35B_2520 [Lactiplantibacillus plantarum]KZT83232.1 hypothetical protein Nizo1839_0228 [Lactiplantibacillus plantarum]